MKYHFLHKRSSVSGKTPSVSTLHYGELAINFNADSPKLHIKNSSDEIVSFIDEEQVKSILKTETSARTEADKALDAKISSNTEAIDALNAKDTELEGKISALSTKVENFVDGYDEEIQAINDKFDELEQAISAEAKEREDADKALDAKISANTEAISAETSARTEAIATLTAKDTELEGKISALRTNTDKLQEQIDSNHSDIATELDEIETEFKRDYSKKSNTLRHISLYHDANANSLSLTLDGEYDDSVQGSHMLGTKKIILPCATESKAGVMSPEDKNAIIENKNAIENTNASIATLNAKDVELEGKISANTEAIANKQEKLESGVNIKTINGMSILGEGDITITSGGEIVGDYATTSFVNEKIEYITDTLSGYTKESEFTEHVESANTRLNQISESLQNKVTSGEVQEMIEQIKQDSDVVALTERVKENEEVHAAALTKLNSLTTNISTKVNTLSGEVTNINSITIPNIIENLASKLSSGDIKTINNQSIIGEGNIDIIGNAACNSTYHIMLEKTDKGLYSLEFIEQDNKENWLTKLVSFDNNGNTEFGVAINVTQVDNPNFCYVFFHDKIIQFVFLNGEWTYVAEHYIPAPQTSTQSLYYITLKENEDKDNLKEKYDLEFDNSEDKINWVTKLVKFGNHTGIAIRGNESGEPPMCHIFFSDRELHFVDQNDKWRCVSEEYYDYITESEVDTKISGVIGTVQLSGKLNLASLEDVKSAQSVLLSTNQVAYYLITDNEGKIPSKQPCYTVPSSVVKQLSLTSPHAVTNAVLSMVPAPSEIGVNVGDLIALTRVKVASEDLLAIIGVEGLNLSGEVEIYQYKVLATNDAKPYKHNGVAAGVSGLMSPWDKEQVNSIRGIADVANKALAFPTHNDKTNMNECLESGIYPWCLLGRPTGAEEGAHYTCITEKSTTKDNSGYFTYRQTCYCREGKNEGNIYQRIFFLGGEKDNWGSGWKQINIEPRISENEEVQAAALVKMETEITQLKQQILTMQEQINNLLNV